MSGCRRPGRQSRPRSARQGRTGAAMLTRLLLGAWWAWWRMPLRCMNLPHCRELPIGWGSLGEAGQQAGWLPSGPPLPSQSDQAHASATTLDKRHDVRQSARPRPTRRSPQPSRFIRSLSTTMDSASASLPATARISWPCTFDAARAMAANASGQVDCCRPCRRQQGKGNGNGRVGVGGLPMAKEQGTKKQQLAALRRHRLFAAAPRRALPPMRMPPAQLCTQRTEWQAGWLPTCSPRTKGTVRRW